jgi:hypothetical protein
MALNWDWNKKIGTIDIFNYDEVRTYQLYQGNAFLIMLWEYEEDGKEMWQMHNFFIDKEHAKNCLGITKDYNNIFDTERYKIKAIRLNKGKYRYTKDLVDMLIKAFDEISIEITNEN